MYLFCAGEFSPDRIQTKILAFLQIAGQNQGVLHARFLEACEKREHAMQKIVLEHRKNHGTRRPICLCTMAAQIVSQDQCKVDPFQCLKPCTNEKLNEIAQRIAPPIIRLLAILKNMDSAKYKGNALSSMILGMMYLCTTGVTCGTVRILPHVPALIQILPNDNRIHFYFGKKMGVNTKCVTDVSNLMNSALKDRVDILKLFENC